METILENDKLSINLTIKIRLLWKTGFVVKEKSGV